MIPNYPHRHPVRRRIEYERLPGTDSGYRLGWTDQQPSPWPAVIVAIFIALFAIGAAIVYLSPPAGPGRVHP